MHRLLGLGILKASKPGVRYTRRLTSRGRYLNKKRRNMLTELEALEAIPREMIPAAIARLAAKLMELPESSRELAKSQETSESILTPDEVAKMLKTDRRWVYRHGPELGAIRLSRRKLRFRATRVRRFLDRL